MAKKKPEKDKDFPTIKEFIEGLEALNGISDPEEILEDKEVANFVNTSLAAFFAEHLPEGFSITTKQHQQLKKLIIQIAIEAQKKKIKTPFLYYLDGILWAMVNNRNDLVGSMRAAFALGWAYGEKGGNS